MKKAALLFILVSLMQSAMSKGNTYNFIVGTFTKNTTSEGIYTLHCDFENPKFEIMLATKDISNPSYLALTADKKYVYSVNESGEQSMISAFAFDKKTGKLVSINKVNAQGADPCYISVVDNHVVTGNYSGGNVCVFLRNDGGSITDVVQNIQHTGSSIDSKRQKKPFVHQTIFAPDKKFLLVNDLGTDYITSYRYDAKAIKNVLTPFDSLKVKAGSGPRHLAFSKNGKLIYLLQELDGTISVIGYKNGKLTLIDETTIVRKENISVGAADIHVSPDGKYLYATNRGTANDITCFGILKNGHLKFIQQTSVLGMGPRNFCITKDGKFVLVGNQGTNQIVVFNRNKKTGELTDSGMKIKVGAPVCLVEY